MEGGKANLGSGGEMGEAEAQAARAAGAVFIDVREQEEWQDGVIPGARLIPRAVLERRIGDEVPRRDTAIVVYCAAGRRSALAARALADLGYGRVSSLAGGLAAWRRAGREIDRPPASVRRSVSPLTPAQTSRYARHVMLPEVGQAGQAKLLASKVLCLGAGGLGSPAGLYLAAAGVGTLGFVDDDLVDASNLQRQVLHATDRVGTRKVDSAQKTLAGLNPDVRVVGHAERFVAANAMDLVAPYDIVVDGTDNFPTRYLLNDVALMLGKPVVHASVYRFEGQLSTFIPTRGPCYRCLYPSPPPADLAPSCQEAGVLGVLPGVLGVLQATEVIKLLLGIGEPLAGRLLVFDALATRFRELTFRRNPACPTCGDGVRPEDIKLIDYEEFCRG